MNDADSDSRADFLRHFIRHEPQIYAFIRSVVPNRADAEDVFQEVAVVMWNKFDKFEPGTRFDSWALRIAHNQVLFYRQKQQRSKISFDDSLLEQLAEDSAGLSGSGSERRDALQSCVEKLPDDERSLIQRRFSGDATNRKVAELTGWSESSVSRALSRIYVNLMRCMERSLTAGN